MIQKTTVIVLSSIKFQETSLIAYCYSSEFGRLSILANGAFSKGKKQGKSIFFQPFSILNVVFYQSSKTELHKLKEVEFSMYQRSIPFEPIKRSIALFISEFIYRTVKEEEPNRKLFDFIELFILHLDECVDGVANLHLLFLAKFMQYVGFKPINTWTEQLSIFDIKSGAFVGTYPTHTLYMEKDLSHLFGDILITPTSDAQQIKLNHQQRIQIIDGIISYYKYHLGYNFEINSLPILSTIFQ